jgi:hypothetical protein
VRRRFGELRPGSAGLVMAKERLNRGPEGVNVMFLAGSSQQGFGGAARPRMQTTPGGRIGLKCERLLSAGPG